MMKEASEERLCPNCGSPVGGRYCSRCGQEQGPTRITWRSLYDEIVSLFIGDSLFGETGDAPRYGMVQTLWCVIRRPAVTIGEFLAGKRRKYVAPLTLLLLVCTICLLTLKGLGVSLLDYTPESDEDSLETLFQQVSEFMSDHLEIVALMKLPGLALAFTWIFRRAPRLSYMEYLYMGLYLASLHILLLTFTALVAHGCHIVPESPVHNLLSKSVTAIILCYNVVVIHRLLRRNWLRSAFGYLLCSAISLGIILATCFVLLIGWGAVNGEF